MTFLLDTNIIIDFFHNEPKAVRAVTALDKNQLAISAITIMELYHGAEKTRTPDRYKGEIQTFVADFSVLVLPVHEAVARVCGTLLAQTEKRGRQMSLIDALIAATAIGNTCTLMTRDRIFGRVPSLDVRIV